MRSPRAWSYVTYLASTFVLGACPTSPAATDTDSDPTTGGQVQTTSTSSDDCPIGDLGCACTQGGACNEGLSCSPDNKCEPAEQTTTSESGPDETTATTTVEPGTTASDTSTTGPVTPCNPDDGQPNVECMDIDPQQPFCSDAGVCGGCTVLPPDGCAIVDPDKPICNPDDGQCVACTVDDQSLCTGATPACNPVNNTCEGCFEHSHCPDTACDILKRECFPIDQVIYVRHGTEGQQECTNKVPQGGYEQAPYCNANLAIEHAQWEGPTSGWTFKFLDTDAATFHGDIHIPSVDVGEPISYAFVHEGSFPQQELSQLQYTRLQSNGAVMTVGANVVAYVNNFSIYSISNQDDNAVGIGCLQNSSVFLDDSYIRDTRGSGIRSFGCDVYLRRSSIYKSRTEGVELNCAEQHCELHMINSYISDNQHVQSDGGGGIFAENATLDIVFSGILGNNAEVDLNDMFARGDSIHCVGDTVDGLIRNSVIGRKQMGNAMSIKCTAKLTFQKTLLDSEEFKMGNHKKASEDILQYFNTNTITGAKPINPEPPMGSPEDLALAIWTKGDPRVDFDGQARTAKDNQIDYVGADVMGP
ncbi:right-handed parallel beta-helix repeat-containing protein [Nannocystis exedens]|uniref:right-handed parallel beta-helix repeat-containing protein n=1 Tax=Nannocystis exedens TaxID=54 RepID=UPI000BC44C2A|nr:right-handed parallel beta-helix repeat-containing protein [Nannocystis exedens]PCC66535.1 hypothetical protein NAEX_09123 [Nannocystis exedens]